MTLDSNLRDKLAALPPDLELGVAPEAIMKRGRRVRAARQTMVAGGAAAAVAAIVATTVALSGQHTTTAQTASGTGVGPATGVAAAADPACGVSPQPTDGAPPAAADGASATPWGNQMFGPSGIAGTKMAVTAVHIGGMPCTNVGFEFALQGAGGAVTNLQETNEFDGSDIAPGFHGTGLSTTEDGWFVVGYYVGPAASITLPADGQSAAAQLASWNVNPDVKVWWVHGTGTAPSAANPAAADVDGNPLPSGAHGGQLGVG